MPFCSSRFLLPSHNNTRGRSTDGEKANIEQAGQTNKSKVYLATCGPAGEDMAIRWHWVLGDSVWWTKWMKTTEALDLLLHRKLYSPLSELLMNGTATELQGICDFMNNVCWVDKDILLKIKPTTDLSYMQIQLWHFSLFLAVVLHCLLEYILSFFFC